MCFLWPVGVLSVRPKTLKIEFATSVKDFFAHVIQIVALNGNVLKLIIETCVGIIIQH